MGKKSSAVGKWIDISRLVSPELEVYPGDPELRLSPVSRISEGNPYNLTLLSMGSHTGTHVDAPRHLFDNGKGVDQLPWESLIGPARVLDFSGIDSITSEHLQRKKIRSGDRILLKTRKGDKAGKKDRCSLDSSLSLEAVRYLCRKKIRTLGTDQMTVEPQGREDLQSHRLLLAAGVVILEGLILGGVSPGRYRLYALPLRLQQGDGAPVRAVLEVPARLRRMAWQKIMP